MSAYDKPVSKLAESPELCTDFETLKGSEQQQAQSVTLGLKTVSRANWDQKKTKTVLEWDRKGGRDGWKCTQFQALPKGNAKSLRLD